MSNTIKIGTNNINAIKLGSIDVDAVYLGTNLVYTSTPPTPPQSSCYEIVSIPITSYTSTTYDSVYSASDEKWYMKNNLNQYEEYGIYETGTSLSDFTYYDGKLTAIGTTEYQWDGSQWQNVGVYESSEITWTIDDDHYKYAGETLSTSFKIPIEDISEIGHLDFRIRVSGGQLMINNDEYTYDNYDSGDYEEGTVTDDGTYLNFSLPTTKEVVVEKIEYWESTPIHLIMEDKEISVEYSAKTVSANVYQSVAEMEAVGCPTVGVGQYGFVGNDIYKYTNNEEWIGTSLQDPKMVAFYSSGTPLVVYNNNNTTLSSGETKTSTLPIEVYVGNSVTLIDELAFYDCKSISACTIGSGVTTIGNSAFRDCSSLTSIVIPSSVTTINSMAFYDCSGLTTCTISNGVTSIGDSAFGNCKSLTSVTIPNSVISIGTSAFQNCSGLTSIEIPNSVISINSFAFDNTPWWNSYSADTSHRYGNIIYINDVAYAATSTGITSCTFKEGSVSIGGGAFSGCKSLTSVNIPNSVTLIGNGAFNNCSGLTNVTIGSGVTTIGNSAFYQCKKLTSVNIPNSVTSIGNGAFNVCSGLTTCTIGSGVTSIGSNAFANCKRLNSIDIPNSVISIGNGAFYNCSGLTTCTIGSGVTSIGGSAFQGCKSLTSIDIPNSVTSIGYQAFDSCSGLTSIEIPNSVTSIEDWAFYGCSGLTSVTVNAPTPPTLGGNAFNNTNNCPIYVPAASVDAYKSSWSTYASRIQAIPT